VKGKVHSRTGHAGPEGEWWNSSTLSLALDWWGGVGQRHVPAALALGRRPKQNPVLVIQKAGWFLGPVWKDAESLAPAGFDPGPSSP